MLWADMIRASVAIIIMCDVQTEWRISRLSPRVDRSIQGTQNDCSSFKKCYMATKIQRWDRNVLKHWMKRTLPCASGIRETKKTKTKRKNTESIFTMTLRKLRNNLLVMLHSSYRKFQRVVQWWCKSWAKLQDLKSINSFRTNMPAP